MALKFDEKTMGHELLMIRSRYRIAARPPTTSETAREDLGADGQEVIAQLIDIAEGRDFVMRAQMRC
jgi:hypothetical protein